MGYQTAKVSFNISCKGNIPPGCCTSCLIRLARKVSCCLVNQSLGLFSRMVMAVASIAALILVILLTFFIDLKKILARNCKSPNFGPTPALSVSHFETEGARAVSHAFAAWSYRNHECSVPVPYCQAMFHPIYTGSLRKARCFRCNNDKLVIFFSYKRAMIVWFTMLTISISCLWVQDLLEHASNTSHWTPHCFLLHFPLLFLLVLL